MDIEFNDQFREALSIMENSTDCLFLTGKAGTGKSTLLDHFSQTTKKNPIILAPTGVAALNVKGQTIHRFFGFGVDITLDKVMNKKVRPRQRDLYNKIDLIIIDEVSMLRADLLDCVDQFLRLYGPLPGAPFGGVQMIFVGDLYQLPPVVTSQEKNIFYTLYASPYFFNADAMQAITLSFVELETIYRQKDLQFIDLLNKVRNNSANGDDIAILNQRYQDEPMDKQNFSAFFVNLTTTNRAADNINDSHLDALKGKLFARGAKIKGEFGQEFHPTAEELHFKIGAQIMLLNNDSTNRWVNGSIGVIEDVLKNRDNEEYVDIRLQNEKETTRVYRHKWDMFRFSLKDEVVVSESAGTFEQYPFRLAWAVTIHKSQGKTFDQVIVDLGYGSFASGQTYVALSRCTSFEGLTLATPIRASDINTDQRIFKFLTGLAYKKASETLSKDERVKLLEKAIDTDYRLKMTYLSANDNKSTHIIKPTFMGDTTYHGKVFPALRAFCDDNEEERLFHLNRIIELKIIE